MPEIIVIVLDKLFFALYMGPVIFQIIFLTLASVGVIIVVKLWKYLLPIILGILAITITVKDKLKRKTDK